MVALFDQNTPDLDGGSGDIGPPDGGSSGGGQPGTQTGGTISSNIPFGENGGVFGSTWFLFVPVEDTVTGNCFIGIFDTTSADDQRDGSSYAFRAEDVKYDRVPTVNRIILTYRDLGLATLGLTLRGVNDNGAVVMQTYTVSLGTTAASGVLLTRFVDVQLSAFRPQLILTRIAGSGPIDITHVTIRGEVEDNT